MTRRNKPYSGSLVQKIILPDRGKRARWLGMPRIVAPSEGMRDAQTIEREREKKLPLLFAHYDIDQNSPDAFKDLARALAFRHVPGFSAQRAQGHRLNVSIHTLCKLHWFARGRKLRSHREAKNSEICGSLAKDAEFKRKVPELARRGKKGLQNLLAEACVRRKLKARALREQRARWHRINQLPATEREELCAMYVSGDIPYWPSPGDPDKHV